MPQDDNAGSLKGEGMVDVSHKKVSARRAQARATLRLGARAYAALVQGDSPKGDVLETAKVAGIMAAKATPQVIPLCHPLELSKVKIQHELDATAKTVSVTAEVVYNGRTGVEMEALTAVSIAALTIYDMLKWADKGMVITETRLLHKSGGKSGDYDFDG